MKTIQATCACGRSARIIVISEEDSAAQIDKLSLLEKAAAPKCPGSADPDWQKAFCSSDMLRCQLEGKLEAMKKANAGLVEDFKRSESSRANLMHDIDALRLQVKEREGRLQMLSGALAKIIQDCDRLLKGL